MLVSADPRIEIPKQQKLILAWYAVDGFTQAGVKGLPLLIWVGHGWINLVSSSLTIHALNECGLGGESLPRKVLDYYLLGKGGHVFGSVGLSVDNAQKVMN